MFFQNLVELKKKPKDCPDNDGHNVDAIDALTIALPVIIRYSSNDRNTRNIKVMEAIKTIRNVQTVEPYAIALADFLTAVLSGKEFKKAAIDAAEAVGMSDLAYTVEHSSRDPMVACYIDSSFPAMLFMVYKYADDFEKGVLASANAGGENVARGAIVGCLLGAYHGLQGMPQWAKDGLY